METLVGDLLTLARAGQSIDELTDVDLPVLARLCWETTASGDATLAVETDRTIRADEERLHQLLGNLFDNAVTHGGEGVTVTVGDLPDGFYVEDDGPGIPAEDREEVFESGYTTAPSGSGLGLAIVEEIAEAHGWSIDLVQGDDGGARFEIRGVDPVG